MGSAVSKEEKARQNKVSPRASSIDQDESVSYHSETSSSTSSSSRTSKSSVQSGTSYSSTVVEQPYKQSKSDKKKSTKQYKNEYGKEEKQYKSNNGVEQTSTPCCWKCECYCDCGRDCTDNCCCQCMKSSFCCFINFIWTLFKYLIIFCIYVIITIVVIACPPLWFLCIFSRGSRGIFRLALWSKLLGLGGE